MGPVAKHSKKLFGFNYHFSDGETAYYFLLIDTVKKALLKRVLKKDVPFKITDYGEIIVSGYGMPTEKVKNLLRDRYSANL